MTVMFSNNQVLFRYGQVAMDPSCCCIQCCSYTITSGCFIEVDSGEVCECLRASGPIDMGPSGEYDPETECERIVNFNDTPDIGNDAADPQCPSRTLGLILVCWMEGGNTWWRLRAYDDAPSGPGDTDPIGWFYDETIPHPEDGCLEFVVPVLESVNEYPCTGTSTKSYYFRFSIDEADCSC